MAQKTAAQHLLAARNRARAAARRRLAHLTLPTTPVHPPTRISSTRPHLSPSQMLKRFDLLCGDLPAENQVLDSRMSPDEFISEVAMGGPVELESTPVDGMLLADNTLPTMPVSEVTPQFPGQGVPQVPIYGPTFGGGGYPITPVAPGSPTGPSKPGSPSGPGSSPVTPIVPVSPVPEPSSVLLVLTGLFGAGASGLRRRFR